MTYEEYNKLSKEQKSAYHEPFYKLKESCHDTLLEQLLNSNDVLKSVDLDVCNELWHTNPLDFELEWNDSEDINTQFSHRISLNYMFKHNFTYAILTEKSVLYKYLLNIPCRHRVLRSPETNIINNDRRQLAVFCEDNNLYCYVGMGFYKSLNTEYFVYLGKII